MVKKIVVATDGEEGLDRLGHCLEALAASGVEQLIWVQALPWQDDAIGLPEDTTPQIEAARSRLRAHLTDHLPVDVVVQIGQPQEVILQAIQRFHPDLLIMGMSPNQLLLEKVFGSTTMTLLPKLTIPLLVIRPQLIAAFTLKELQLRCRGLLRSLLFPCDAEATQQPLLPQLIQICQKDPSHCQSILILHVLDTSSRRLQGIPFEELRQQALLKLTPIQQTLQQALPHTQITIQVEEGSPVQQILKTAASADVTAIALTSQNAGRFWELSIPSVTGELLRRSWHPVLFFPSRAKGSVD
ncbi:MAG: universal stress protein [Cyanobacteriota bacterium]|nr:universal stress protein [Cyanobacteriota bacterium]